MALWTAPLDHAGLRADAGCLDDNEFDRAARFVTSELRSRYVASHVALRTVLAAYAGLRPKELRFDRTCLHCGHESHGRPRLAGSVVEFSLSHGGAMCVIGVAAQPVGADVEPLGGRTRAGELLRRTTTEREQRRLEHLDGDERERAFLHAWCRKEAYLKGLGVGIVAPMRDIDVLGDGGSAAPVVDQRATGAWGWHAVSTVVGGHVCAVATFGEFELDVQPL